MERLTPLRKVTQLAWRRHLISEHGVEGLLVLRENAPAIIVGDADSIIFQAGIVEGYKRAIENMHNLIAAEQIKTEDFDNK